MISLKNVIDHGALTPTIPSLGADELLSQLFFSDNADDVVVLYPRGLLVLAAWLEKWVTPD